MTSLIEPINIKQGQKIAQLVVSYVMYPEIKNVNFLKDTERDNKGFGKMGEIDFSEGFGKEFSKEFREKDADEIFEIQSPYLQKSINKIKFIT